jgi:major vault protein
MLEYDETLEVLELSTGKPKSDGTLMRTVYMPTSNNIVSDIIEVETKDSVNCTVRLSYRVNFKEDDAKKWFSVSNYVKLMTQHLRSVVRNSVKKYTIEEFNNTATDIIRDTILGPSKEGKREGKSFDENGMNVYDVEVLNVRIGDDNIARMLKDAQYNTVEKNLLVAKEEKNLEYVKKTESFEREKIKEKADTEQQRMTSLLEKIKADAQAELDRLTYVEEQQEKLGIINDATLDREEKSKRLILNFLAAETDIEIKKVKEKMAAITPGLVEAITSLGTVSLSEILAKNLKIQTSGLHGIFPEGGIEGLIHTIKGTPLEKKFSELLEKTPISTNGTVAKNN